MHMVFFTGTLKKKKTFSPFPLISIFKYCLCHHSVNELTLKVEPAALTLT